MELIRNKKCSCADLSEKFEVSRKTIYRYCTILSSSGIPLYCSQGRNGGIEIMPSFNLASNYFTTNEIARMRAFLSGTEISNLDVTSRSLKDKIDKALNDAGNKKIAGNDNSIIIDNLPWGAVGLNSEKILSLESFCKTQKAIKIKYTDRNETPTIRTINPYFVLLKDGVWYLYAFCRAKKAFRLFKCSRIESIAETGEVFEKMDINLENKPWLVGGFPSEKVTIIAKYSILPELYDWLGDKIQISFLKQNAKLTFSATLNSGLINRLLCFGNKLKIISPKQLAKSLSNTCKEIEKLYY
ncbi:MAG: WYL domain-containing protein [Clostridia bacterium]|nr:WYL domain-containing protein [Clostridia bacterium]